MEICSINESFLELPWHLFSPCLWAESCPVGLAGPLKLFPHFPVADLVSFTLIKGPSRAALESQVLQDPQGQRAAHGCFLTFPGATWLPPAHPPILLGLTHPEEYGLVWAPGVWLVKCTWVPWAPHSLVMKTSARIYVSQVDSCFSPPSPGPHNC